ncbi:MAG: phosphatidate cytidylyltransferase [Paracoccaceae bacterium]
MSDRWSDLASRLGSAAIMAIVGLWGIWAGSDVFHLMVAVITGLMVWELVRMIVPRNEPMALHLGLLAGLASMVAIYVPTGIAFPLLLAPALIGFFRIEKDRALFFVYSVMVLLAGFGMMSIRDNLGFGWMAWLVLVVIATDVLGYFAGRIIGGPKFWPAVSPKKTWSGTAGGWIGAAIVGAIYAANSPAMLHVIGVSIAVSMASQMGDVAESAIKRRTGVKDSSNLIPGHGGVLDRFDGMLGASVFLLVVGPLVGFPPGLN